MRKQFIIILILSMLYVTLQAQPYRNAVGIRAGFSSGLNYKHITYDDLLIEGKALYNRHGFQFTGIAGYQFSPYDKKKLQYYAGGGIFAGNWDTEPAVGFGVLVGTEYVFRQVPLAIGLEWNPMFKLYKTFAYAIPDVGLTVRFLIN